MPGGLMQEGAAAKQRTLALWCPDWPVAAGIRQMGASPSQPAAVFHANRVRTCNAAARAEGIGSGQRRRDAQSRWPELLVLTADQDRDARMFEPVAVAVESMAPAVEILRPGLLVCPARGPARYFGSEVAAAERIVDAVEALDVECQVGVADSLAVAVMAARRSIIVEPGGSAAFCAPLPIEELARDPAIALPDRADLVNLLQRLGITTVGQFAQLPEEKVATRFGGDALVAHRLARGVAERGVFRRSIPEDLVVEQLCDPPLARVDTAAFLARALAEQFHTLLADAGLACTRLAISATTDRGHRLTRTWRCARPLTSAATADRLRWQLDGWLTAGRTLARNAQSTPIDEDGLGPGGITRLRLEPVEAVGAGLIQYGLWGSDGEDDQRAGWACARVQGLLGPESVLSPVLSGGRGPQERITLVPWGEEKVPLRDPSAPWPGALPSPSPAHLRRVDGIVVADLMHLYDESDERVVLTDRGSLSAEPVRLAGQQVDSCWLTEWAGPWLLDERWWAPRPDGEASGPAAGWSITAQAPLGQLLGPAGAYSLGPHENGYHSAVRRGQLLSRRLPEDEPARVIATPAPAIDGTLVTRPARHRARLQVLTDTGVALLLLHHRDGWVVEGVYD